MQNFLDGFVNVFEQTAQGCENLYRKIIILIFFFIMKKPTYLKTIPPMKKKGQSQGGGGGQNQVNEYVYLLHRTTLNRVGKMFQSYFHRLRISEN